jgi:Sulfotransferase family
MIFIHIQRTGGDSISTALGEGTNSPDKHFSALELRKQCGLEIWNSYFKFAFVRNPWDRLISWWSMINACRAAYERGEALNKFQTFVLSRATTFDLFLDNCDQIIFDNDGTKSIYNNQIDYLVDDSGNFLVDFVGRFEHLQRDFSTVTQKCFGQALVLPPSNKKRTHNHHYSTYYNSILKDKIAARFARDIDAFGYAFENPE